VAERDRPQEVTEGEGRERAGSEQWVHEAERDVPGETGGQGNGPPPAGQARASRGIDQGGPPPRCEKRARVPAPRSLESVAGRRCAACLPACLPRTWSKDPA